MFTNPNPERLRRRSAAAAAAGDGREISQLPTCNEAAAFFCYCTRKEKLL
jgi:hypothetical protein